jgi:hypothetical protein
MMFGAGPWSDLNQDLQSTTRRQEVGLRTLAITQNVTVDGSIERLGDWFGPQGEAGVDNSDLLDEVHRQDREADALLVGRRTFEDLRSYWPEQSDDPTGITDYLNACRSTSCPRP